MTIYTLGYSGWKIEDVEALLDRLDAVLVDVRMVPRSRVATWNVGVLGRRLGHRYVSLREFGNRNYKGGPIDIVDFPAGQAKLKDLLHFAPGENTGDSPACLHAGRKAIILLCGCADVTICHRKLLADWLAQAWQAEVEHLAPSKAEGPALRSSSEGGLTAPANQVGGGQKKLF